MKSILLSLLGFSIAISTTAGEVSFVNNSASILTTNNCGLASGITTGAGQYTIGLYVAPFGTRDLNEFTLIATTPNQSGLGIGKFNGGIVSHASLVAGVPITFQIRAWSTFAGATFEQAIGNFQPGRYLGVSFRGLVIPSAGGAEVAPPVMGNGYGQVPGFILYPCITPPFFVNPTLAVSLQINRSNNSHAVSWPNSSSTHLLESTPVVPGSNQWTAIFTNVANSNGRLTFTATNTNTRFYRLRTQ